MLDAIAAMPRYESYKNSGIEWLGDIPRHWIVEKGKWIFKKESRPIQSDDEVITCFRDGQVTLRKNRKTDGFTNALQEIGYQRVCKGDLVIHAMDAFAGAIGVSDSYGKSSPVYSVCTPLKSNSVDPAYYSYLLRDLALSGVIVSLAKGIRERSTDFRFNDFGGLHLSIPPLEEQEEIVAFLDQKTAQINQAIAIKERQIALLKERKQIIIQNAVTKGINPDAPMKASGVDWLSDIPAHWEVRKLKYLSKINCNALSENTPIDFQLDYVDISNVNFENGIENSDTYTFADAPSRARRIARAGDTIVSTVRTYLKAIDYINDEKSHYIFSTGFAVVEPLNFVHPEYLTLFISSSAFTNQVEAKAKGVSYPAISGTELNSLLIAFPPMNEMKSIAKYINLHSRALKSQYFVDFQLNHAASRLDRNEFCAPIELIFTENKHFE